MDTAWKVTSQRQTTISNGDKYVPAMIITFRTAGGAYASITVDRAEYTPAKVTKLISAEADRIDDIGRLHHGTVDIDDNLNG